MGYIALYRKYRPKSFEEMVGQDHIRKTLDNAIKENRIAHAYLFCGPRGTGKTTAAKIFAKAINCGGINKPCDECENCKAANDGSFPDIIEIDAASNNGVDEVRNLIEKVNYAPSIGKYKVYIIDEVHMMTNNAYNALLKTIEEPPAHVIFIMATTEPYKVLPTIISRCQRYDFNKISDHDIVFKLKEICAKENIAYEKGVLENIAVIADGGMRDALSILDQCYAYAPEKITNNNVFEIYGIVTTQEKLEIIESVNKKNTIKLMQQISNLDSKGVDIKRFTTDLIEINKEKVIYDFTKNRELLHILSEQQVKELEKFNSTDDSLKMIDILMDNFEKYRYTTRLISYLEIALLKITNNVSRETLKRQEIETDKKLEATNINKEKNNNVIETSDEDESFEPMIEDPIDEDDILNEQTVLTDEDVFENKVEDKEESKQIVHFVSSSVKIKSLDDQLILRLLVGANKPERIEDNKQISGIKKYQYDSKYSKYAHLLDGCEIIASADTYVLVSMATQALANEINELDKEEEFGSFVEVLFKKYKRVFAISNIQKDRAIDEFKEKYQSNSLPEPIEINVERENKPELNKEDTKDETEKALNILFGNNFEIKENE